MYHLVPVIHRIHRGESHSSGLDGGCILVGSQDLSKGVGSGWGQDTNTVMGVELTNVQWAQSGGWVDM